MNWDFALILFVLLVLSGSIWLTDFFWLRTRRRARAVQAMAATSSAVRGMEPGRAARIRQEAYDRANRAPWWVEYGASFFPVILFVFVLRSFVVEPFRIPSGSMLPTLQNGDLILVNKYQYGIRLPVIDTKVVPLGEPRRGDVVVFRYPVDPSIDYIKRVVGVPGDIVSYHDKQLSINDAPVEQTRVGDFFEPDRGDYIAQFDEKLGATRHNILLDRGAPQRLVPISDYPMRDHCEYSRAGVQCKVPDGHYFMMGDNRDNSLDSRYWGFVADRHIVGRAFFIWMNFSHPSRIGRFQ